MKRREWCLIVVFWLMGCVPQPAILPTRMAVAAPPMFPTATTVTLPVPTPLLTSTPPSTAISPQPTPSILPTSTSPTRPSTTLPRTPTNTPISPNPDPNTCRTAAQLADAQPTWRVQDGPWPRPAASAGLLGRAPDAGLNLLHLGFDVEGDPYFIGDLLDVLDRRQVKTTLFMLGSWADTYPEWVQEMARRGHEIASHGYTHADMAQMTAVQVRWELGQTETAVANLIGQTTQPWLRPPFGSYSGVSLEAAYASGYTTVIWTGSSNDWRSNMDATKMCETLRYYAVPGAILYAHTNRAAIVEAVDRFIAEAQLDGFIFVPLSVLMVDDPAAWLELVNDQR